MPAARHIRMVRACWVDHLGSVIRHAFLTKMWLYDFELDCWCRQIFSSCTYDIMSCVVSTSVVEHGGASLGGPLHWFWGGRGT